MDLDHSALAGIIAKENIREVIYRRSRAADRKDIDLARSCYHPDATEDHAGFFGPVDEYLAQSPISGGPESPVRSMWHFIGNVLIQVDGDAATSEAYFYSQMLVVQGEQSSDMIIAGRYLDRFSCRNGKWAIDARQLVFDWSRIDPTTAAYWTAMNKNVADLTFGRPDRDDPVYSL